MAQKHSCKSYSRSAGHEILRLYVNQSFIIEPVYVLLCVCVCKIAPLFI
jgi:hypothetical protein